MEEMIQIEREREARAQQRLRRSQTGENTAINSGERNFQFSSGVKF